MTIASLVTKVRKTLKVDVSYEAEVLTDVVRRCAKRLLRDYNFPKSVQREVYLGVEGGNTYALPGGFKKELFVAFRGTDVTNGEQWTPALLKREGIVLPDSSGEARYYWMEGTNLLTDITLPANPEVELVVIYQSLDIDFNLWLLNDFEDGIFSFCMFRAAVEMSKPETAQIWAALWQEDQRSLAVYLNELEFDNSEILMRATGPVRHSRYPAVV